MSAAAQITFVCLTILAVCAFVVTAFVLVSKLLGPRREKPAPEKKQRIKPAPAKQPEESTPAAGYPAQRPAAPAFPAAPAQPLPDLLSHRDLLPSFHENGAAGYPAAPAPMASPVYSPAPAPMQNPAPGRVNYGSATRYVDISEPEANPVFAALPVQYSSPAVSPSGVVMRLTISGDNGAPTYFVDIHENELPVTIGRGRSDARGKSIVVNETSVSTQHARIGVKKSVLYVHDFSSTCGTVISGEGGEAIVLRNEKKETETNLFADRFALTLGRMNVQVQILDPLTAALRTGCRLTVSASFAGGQPARFSFTDDFSVGRQNADLLLSDPKVSRAHAVVSRSLNGDFIIRDNNSLNGIFTAAGEQISEAALSKGTVLTLGDTTLRVEQIDRGVPREEAVPTRPRTVYYDSISNIRNPYFV